MTLDNLFSEIDTASELYALKRMVRDRALQLIDTHFTAHPVAIASGEDEDDELVPLIEDEVSDDYGDEGEIIRLSADGYVVRGKETGDHSDMSYADLDTDVLLQVVAHLEEVRQEVEA